MGALQMQGLFVNIGNIWLLAVRKAIPEYNATNLLKNSLSKMVEKAGKKNIRPGKIIPNLQAVTEI